MFNSAMRQPFNTPFCLLTAALVITTGVLTFSAKEQLFKINKLNLLFDKAQHSLGTNKLKDLRSDLSRHESDELNLKKMKAHGQDKDGLMEASVRRKLQSIMKKYSIEKFYHDIHPATKDTLSTRGAEKKEVPTFRDSKLDKLWKKAEKAGFPQEQLMILHEEFQHQQDKIDEHYKTANMLGDQLYEDIKVSDRNSNSLESLDSVSDIRGSSKQHKETTHEKKARLSMNVEQSLKDKHNNIKRGYEDLHEKIKSKSIDSSGPFKESRVNELWAMASQSNFTQGELQSLKEELEHYEIRIEKLKHFQNQLDRHKIETRDYATDHGDNDEFKHTRRKVEELTRKVAKADKTIVARIIKEEL